MTAVIVSRKKIPLCLIILVIFISVICLPHINALQYPPQNHRIIAEDTNNNDIFCTDDVNECPDGTFVSRDPSNGCNFEPCSEDKVIEEEEPVDENEDTEVDTKLGDTDNIEQTDPTTIDTEEEQSPQSILPEETNIENDEEFVTEEAIGTLEDDEEDIPPPNVFLPPEQESGIEASDSTIMEETDVLAVIG